LGVLIKRSAFAIGFLFVWFLIENIGFLIFGKLIVNDFELARSIFRYMPLEAMSGVLIEPFTKLDMIQAVGNQVGVLEIKDYTVDYGLVAVVLVWTGLFVWGSYALIQKRDL